MVNPRFLDRPARPLWSRRWVQAALLAVFCVLIVVLMLMYSDRSLWRMYYCLEEKKRSPVAVLDGLYVMLTHCGSCADVDVPRVVSETTLRMLLSYMDSRNKIFVMPCQNEYINSSVLEGRVADGETGFGSPDQVFQCDAEGKYDNTGYAIESYFEEMLKASPIRTTNASGASLFFHPFHAADLYYTLKTRRYANHLPKIPAKIIDRSAWFLNMTLEKSEKWFLLDRSLGSTARALWERSFTIISKDGGVAEYTTHLRADVMTDMSFLANTGDTAAGSTGHRFDARRDVTTVCSVDPARQLAATAILHHKSSRHRPIYLFFVGNNGTHFIREKIRESFLHSCRYGIVDNVTQAWENSFPEINSPAHSSCSFVLENLATNSVKWPNPQRTASSDHFDGGESNDGRRSARRKRDEPIRRTTDTNSLSLPTPTPTLTPDVHYYPSESLQSYDAYPLVVMHSAPITAENGHLGKNEYNTLIGCSRFCLAPRGHSVWSPRLIEYIWLGCVPVIVADNYHLPLSCFVEWEKMSVLVAEKDADKLEEIVAAISNEEYEEKRSYLMRMRQRFTYPEISEATKPPHDKAPECL